MAKLLKLRRGTTSQHSSFTGAEGEVTVDTDKETLIVHDGSTAGGHAVAAEDMANVSSANIVGRLGSGSIANAKLAAINTAKIADDAITSAKIADDAVNSEHIADGAVDLAHMSVNSINSDQYVDGSIDHVHLSNDCIDGDNIQDDVVNSEHIAAGAVDLEHMSSESVDEDNLKISNSGSNGQFLSKQSGNTGGLTWATVDLSPYAPLASPTFTGTANGANLTLSGNLTVNGTTTTVATTNTTLTDNLLELNSGASSNANDSGILIERGSTGDNAIIAWDESADKFTVGTTTGTASSTGNISITTGTLVANVEGNVTGNVTGNTSGSSGSCTGNAATATQLATARNIGGVSFNGTSAINLPGVNTAGNQNTSGNAATATTATNVVAVSNTSNTAYRVPFLSANTGTAAVYTDTDSGMTYNPSTNTLTSAAFAGNLTGNITGSAATVTSAAQSAITSVGSLTSLTVNGGFAVGGEVGLFNGSTNAGRFIDCGLGDGNALTIRGCSGGDANHETLASFTRNAGCVLAFDNATKLATTAAGVTVTGTVSDSKGNLRSIPFNSTSGAYNLAASDAGKVVGSATSWTIPASTFSSGDAVTLLNLSGSAIGLTASALSNLWNTADGVDIKASTLTLGARTMATIYFQSASEAFIQAAALTVS